MNRRGFLKAIQDELKCDDDYILKIDDVLEENGLFGKKNKEKTTIEFMNKLNIEREEAEKIYETASSIAAKAIKDKIRHPFRSTD